MKKFIIEANVKIKVESISGIWEKKLGALVNAPNAGAAKAKFEALVRADYAHMMAQSFTFNYTMDAYPEI